MYYKFSSKTRRNRIFIKIKQPQLSMPISKGLTTPFSLIKNLNSEPTSILKTKKSSFRANESIIVAVRKSSTEALQNLTSYCPFFSSYPFLSFISFILAHEIFVFRVRIIYSNKETLNINGNNGNLVHKMFILRVGRLSFYQDRCTKNTHTERENVNWKWKAGREKVR